MDASAIARELTDAYARRRTDFRHPLVMRASRELIFSR
jgi:hypothetical protein